MRDRGAEQRHETIAGKLRHGAAKAAYFGYAGVEKSAQQLVQLLRANPLGKAGRIDDVAEQDGDLFELAGREGLSRCVPHGADRRQVATDNRCAALAAEFVFRRI